MIAHTAAIYFSEKRKNTHIWNFCDWRAKWVETCSSCWWYRATIWATKSFLQSQNRKLWQIFMLAQIELWWKIVVEWNDIEKKHRLETHKKKRFDKAEKMYVESCKTPTTAKLALVENYVQQANIMMKLLCVQNSLSPQDFTFLQLHTSLSLTASFDRAASSCSR